MRSHWGDGDVDVLGVDDRGIVRRGEVKLAPEQRRDLSCDTDHRQEIDAVHRRSDVQHLVSDRKDVDERRPRLPPVGQHDDPVVVLADAELACGADHPG